jgi:hypothetical protein
VASVVTSDPRLLEELTLNAWPPLETLLFDGWVLSFSDGYTRRANSIHPLYPARLPLSAKIETCEAIYAARSQQAVFKLTSSEDDAQLDRALADLAYQLAATTSVQTAPLAPIAASAGVVSTTNPRYEAGGHLERDSEITLATSLEATWLADFNRLSATPTRFEPTMRALLEKIVPAHTFASITHDGQAVALGLRRARLCRPLRHRRRLQSSQPGPGPPPGHAPPGMGPSARRNSRLPGGHARQRPGHPPVRPARLPRAVPLLVPPQAPLSKLNGGGTSEPFNERVLKVEPLRAVAAPGVPHVSNCVVTRGRMSTASAAGDHVTLLSTANPAGLCARNLTVPNLPYALRAGIGKSVFFFPRFSLRSARYGQP